MSGVRKNKWKVPLLVLLMGGAAGVESVRAQFTSDHQTNLISATTNSWPGAYYVGSNTLADALLIQNAGVLSNADAHVGYLPASSNNYALVSGAGSIWSNANLHLGYSGLGNTVVVSNAGRIENNQAVYMAYDTSSSSNRLLVNGTNSLFDTASALFVGYSGPGNSLVITNGGRVTNLLSYVGDGPSSSGNTALITGAGSVWTNNGACTVGYQGANNTLTVNKGGRLYSAYATIGYFSNATSNSVVVSDTGSLWDDSAVASDINFGMQGSGNSLLVTNGGQVLGYYAYFGRQYCGYNSALVTGPGSSFSVNCYIYAGYQGHHNAFTAANGAAISDKFCYISYFNGSSNNSVLITGTNTSWQNSYSVFVGFNGSSGSLTISNGATLSVGGAFATTHDGALSVYSTSHNNRALVTGPGSLWTIADNMYVGFEGTAGSLVISNGAKLSCTEGYVGTNPGGDTNTALVTGAGSVWTNSAGMYVGYLGVNNSLIISNGGRVFSANGNLAADSTSSNNSAVVTGAGSLWTNSGNVYVGSSGVGNSLVISNTATVYDQWGVIGEDATSSNNSVRVESGALWRNQRILVGDNGSHNALYVNGGTVLAAQMVVGNNPAYCDNLTELDNGTIIVTNSTHDAVLEVYGGTLLLTGGTLTVDTLRVTNPCAQVKVLGGTLTYRNLVLNPNGDTDGDGIPNAWEQAKGLNSLNPLDAASDNDGDGMSNLQEYLAGTNPTNSSSSFRITSAVRTSNDIRLNWKAVGGKSYVVQKSSAPTVGFTDLSPVITIPGTAETVTNFLHVGAATNWPPCYYRVRLGP